MARTRILIVEDLSSLAIAYAAHLERAGYEAVIVETGAQALRMLDGTARFGAILLDLQLPDTDGLSLLRDTPRILEQYPVVVATADASLSRAIEAMRLGAFEFLVKPVSGKRLVAVIESAVELGMRRAAEQDASEPAPEPAARPARRARGAANTGANAGARVKGGSHPGHFIGSSAPMQEVYRQIACVANSRATVFITGESGTGKEVCAEAIHRESGRANGPFVAVNCGAIPENLLESELFGHLKGSFTGAVTDRIGAAQAAHKGTLFLDEICEMALPLQVKLLRFLQTGAVQRVGSNRVEEVDVRIICATNRDPQLEVAEGRFREDLYYRLAVVPLHMPPLRARAGDIAELAGSFLQRFAREEHKQFAGLSPDQVTALESYPWPGNVRELQNIIRRAAVLYEGPQLPMHAFPAIPPARQQAPAAALVKAVAPSAPALAEPLMAGPIPPELNGITDGRDVLELMRAMSGLTLDQIERIAIEGAIDAAGGSLPAAARVLGVSPSTLYRKRERWAGMARSA